MNFILSILAFVLMLSLIIVIHEGGHFMAAKHFGVYCKEFSLGMGPAIFQKQKKETTYSLRAVPIGGYVMMAGESDQNTTEEDDWQKEVPAEQRLNNKPVWQQIVIMAAGVFMNFVLAIVLIVGYSVINNQQATIIPVVDSIVENSAAQAAGIAPGDTIVSITKVDGSTIEPQTQQEVAQFLAGNEDQPLDLVIERDGKTLDFEITPQFDEESQSYLIGYQAAVEYTKLGFVESVQAGFERFGSLFGAMIQAIGQLFSAQNLDQLSGPVGIYQVTSQSVTMGFEAYLLLIALISLNIGLFNLLPIPALDGGRIVLLAVEKVFGRKIPEKVVTGLIAGSFILLVGIMLFATYNDISRLFF